ncbi:MAG: hypothetical protein HYS07_08380 [Chlamydiae bacterium]|nr:hypothetical protein [Chlamydiota bacterium]
MQKKQHDLCMEILRRLQAKDLLRHVILIGSWCALFYKEYFPGETYLPSLRTRDIDFLVPSPQEIKKKVDLFELFKDLGFIVGFRGKAGYIRLEHPELMIEFLVPEKGKGRDTPFPLPQWGLNAQALRFLDLLIHHVIYIHLDNLSIAVPHPANFGVHKILISSRRKQKEMAEKDIQMGIGILKAVIQHGESAMIPEAFRLISKKWKTKILKILEEREGKDFCKMLEGV